MPYIPDTKEFVSKFNKKLERKQKRKELRRFKRTGVAAAATAAGRISSISNNNYKYGSSSSSSSGKKKFFNTNTNIKKNYNKKNNNYNNYNDNDDDDDDFDADHDNDDDDFNNNNNNNNNKNNKKKKNNKKNNNNNNNNEEDEDDPFAAEIAFYEKELGLNKNKKYWKKQEFVNDGLDCFFDLSYFSGESDVDEKEMESYKPYLQTLDNNNNNNNNNTQNYKDEKALQKQKKQTLDSKKTSDERVQEKQERRQRREELYGKAVDHSDDDNNNKEMIEGKNTKQANKNNKNKTEEKNKNKTEEKNKDNNNSRKRNLKQMQSTEIDQETNTTSTTTAAATATATTTTKNNNTTTSSTTGKYVPPQMRQWKEKIARPSANVALERQIQSYLNRLNEANLEWAVQGLMEIQSSHTQNDIVEGLCHCITNAMRGNEDSRGLHHIGMCNAAFITAVYYNIGTLIGSSIIEKLSLECHQVIKENSENVQWNHETKVLMISYLRLFVYLHLFGVLTSKFVVELLLTLIQCCEQHQDRNGYSLVYVPLKLCGKDLRNNSPVEFRDLVMTIMNWHKSITKDTDINNSDSNNNNNNNNNNNDGNTVEENDEWSINTTMKLIYDIKDNRINNNEYESNVTFSNLQNKLNKIKAALTLSQDLRLNIGFMDILKIPTHGRWWLAGAARKGGHHILNISETQKNNNSIWKNADANTESFSSQILELAKKFHMHTPIRKAVFCIVMSSEDYMDAFTKLMQLNLGDGKHQDMIRIILLLALRQKTYNRYYYLLLEKVLKEKKHWRFTFQCAIWDKFKEISTMNDRDIVNLGKLLSEMLISQVIKMTILKSLDIMKVCPKNILLVYTLFDDLLEQHLRTRINLQVIFGIFSGNKETRNLRSEIILFLTSVMKPRLDLQIQQEKKLPQLRHYENKKLSLNNAIDYMQDYMVMSSNYDYL